MATDPTTTPALQDRYCHAWTLLPGETDLWWSQCKGIALDRATLDAEAGPLDEVDVVVPLVPAPATVDREFLLGLHRQAQDNQRAAAAQSEDAFQFWSGVSGWINSMIRKLPAVPAADEDQRNPEDLVRAVSAALHSAYVYKLDHTPVDWTVVDWQPLARAAIAAMREVRP